MGVDRVSHLHDRLTEYLLEMIDWIHDSTLERKRRLRNAQSIQSSQRLGSQGEITVSWLIAQVRKAASAGQSWFVVTLVGEDILLRFLESSWRLLDQPGLTSTFLFFRSQVYASE